LPIDLPYDLRRDYLTLKFKALRSPEEEARFQSLESRVLNWPRTPGNDPYAHSLRILAEELERRGRYAKVWVAFNEFCRPKLIEAIEDACRSEIDVIVVVTTMTTRGGEHSEVEIPAVIDEYRGKCRKEIIYAWPFDVSRVVNLLSDTIEEHLLRHSAGRQR